MRENDASVNSTDFSLAFQGFLSLDGKPHNVCADVASKLRSDPILAAAIIWIASPQSMLAIDAIFPTLLESKEAFTIPIVTFNEENLHPTSHDK